MIERLTVLLTISTNIYHDSIETIELMHIANILLIVAALPAVNTFFQGIAPMRLGVCSRSSSLNLLTKLTLQPLRLKKEFTNNQRSFLQGSMGGSIDRDDLSDDFFGAMESQKPHVDQFDESGNPHGRKGPPVSLAYIVKRYAGGGKYEGEWLDGQRHGFGKQTFPNGEILEGEYRNGKIVNGKGTLVVNQTGFIYRGTWVNGRLEGYGEHESADGYIYKGTFRNGLKQGHGTQVYSDTGTYEGEWKDHKKHGHGKFTSPNGHVMEGEWRDDEMYTATGTRMWRDGTTFTGEMIAGYWQGPGTLVNRNGVTYTGFYIDGLLNGPGTVLYPDGQLYNAEFVEGRLARQIVPVEPSE